jgi:hypothetical protein
VKVGVGNIRGSAEIKMELSEAVKPLRAQYKGQGTAVGSQVTVSAGFDLSALPEGTRVVWQGETSVFGKLASMAGGMLEPLGRKNIQKLIEGLQKALSVPAASTSIQVPEFTEPVTSSDNVGVPQSGMPVEAPRSTPSNVEAQGEPASPADAGLAKSGASTPAQEHGNDNAQPNR